MGNDKKAKASTHLYDKPITPFDPKNIEYLAIQGAGGKGAAYLGALKAIEDLEILKTTDGKGEKKEVLEFEQLKGIAGNSAGTVTALMLSLGYSANEINEMVVKNPLFLLTLGEKSQLSRYRAYKSSDPKDGKHPQIGFTFPGYNKNLKSNIKKQIAKGLQRTNVDILEDKYTLSSKIIEGFQGTKNPNQLIEFLKKTRGGFISPLKVALFKGILESLSNRETITNIADELYTVCFEEFEAFKRRSRIINTATLGLYNLIFSDIEEILDDLFEKWENEREEGAIGYLIFVLFILIYFYFAIYAIEDIIDTGKDDCSKTKERKRKSKETMGTVKMYMKFLWHSNIPKTPILTSLWKESKKLLDFSFNSTIKNIDAFNTINTGNDKNLFTILSSFSTKINLLTNGDLSGLINSITIEYGRILPTIIKPISTILSEGGLLDGCRLRFIIAKLIYEKVEVILDAKDDFKFKRRKKDLTKEVLENLESIFNEGKTKKPLKSIKKGRDKLEIRLEFLQKDKMRTLKDIAALKVDIELFLKQYFRSENFDNSPDFNFSEDLKLDLSLEEKGVKNLEDKIDALNQIIGLYDMRKHLEIIERHYTFEEHKKLFNHYLVICSANITSGVSSYFNAALTPDFSIVEASGMSMNIPGLWKPVAVDYMPKKGQGRLINETDTDEAFYQKYYYGWFVDGGISENIPLFAFNGYSTGDEKLKDEVATRSPEEMAKFNEEFPKGKILGISNFGGKCKGKENYKGGQDAKDDKEQAVWREEAFDINKKSFLSVGGDIFSSFFEYQYKLRGFEIEPYKSHILTVDYGFMGTFDFAANIDELIRVEENNYTKTALFFGDEEMAKNPKVVNDPKKLDKDGRKRWKKSRVNQKKLYRKPFFSKLK